ncbi:hypothetical protein ACHQM5_012135 [Ranunculus cassubicifolius]
MAERRGSIAYFATYRPPVPLDIYACDVSDLSEVEMTDGESYNYNGQAIPKAALRTLIKRRDLSFLGTKEDVNSGYLTGMLFVSERDNLEILHMAFQMHDDDPHIVSLADIFGTDDFDGVRMEDSGCFAGDNLIYVSTKEPATERRQPWTAVYKTNLKTGRTTRLTPPGVADLNPSVSPSGKEILVASFESNGGWDGEIEDLSTDIFVMDVEIEDLSTETRTKIVTDGGWPTWGSDDVIFFHRKDSDSEDPKDNRWGVYRANVSRDRYGDVVRAGEPERVTPENIDAITPAAIDATTVAVATIRRKSGFDDIRVEAQYRHIEIFESSIGGSYQSTPLTRRINGKADHFNPFVIDGGELIGYHRCNSDVGVDKEFQKLDSAEPGVGLIRVSGVFPTFTKDGSKIAFVDNEFKALWVADRSGVHLAYEEQGSDSLFSPVWNQNPDMDTLYICEGPAFNAKEGVRIRAITHVSSYKQESRLLTNKFNSAFPSSSPEGDRLVFRSTRRGSGYKNLYIMEDADAGEFEGSEITSLTRGKWTDTHCQWSPISDWIVFSSTRDKPEDAEELDNGLDPGYFAVYLVNVDDRDVVVRVMGSGDDLAGHINHPFFSPDGCSIVVAADLAGVSVDPISLPLFVHSVRPYGDIFTFDIDPHDIENNWDISEYNRVTHSRYENSTATWTMFSTHDPNAAWNMLRTKGRVSFPRCPIVHQGGGESWNMSGHLNLKKRCC